MDSTAEAGSSASNGLTPAQRLQQEHAAAEAHHVTVEDVPDEEDLAHPVSAPKPTADPTISMINGGAVSAKVMGKQRATDGTVTDVPASETKGRIPAALDTASEEAFPSLGPAKAVPMASTWGSRPAAARANGAATGGASSGAPTPMSMPNRSSNPMAQRPSQGVSIPGRYTEDMRMPSDQLRTDLKRPIGDLLKDINRKYKAKVDMKRGNGVLIFSGQGPNVDAVHEILREVAAQFGQKVCHRKTHTMPVRG
jgi:hypothetical protein